MKFPTLLCLCLLGGAAISPGQEPAAQEPPEILILPQGENLLTWYGHSGRSYFIQISDPNAPLEKWFWAPVIEGGADAAISYEVGATSGSAFFRIHHTDQVPDTGETLDTADFDDDGIPNLLEISPPNGEPTHPLNQDTDRDGLLDGWERTHYLDPNENGSILIANGASGDPDRDGLTNEEEQALGADPNNPDSDGDGITDGGEANQNSDPNDPEDTPAAEWLILTGDLEEGMEKSRSRTLTIPAGESRLLVIALASEEYPDYTSGSSEYNDILEWDIRPEGKDPVSGIIDVNSYHDFWIIAEEQGTEIQSFTPAYIETVEKFSAPGGADLEIVIDLSATNIGDGTLPSTVMIGLLPVQVKDNTDYTGVDEISKTAIKSDPGFVEDFWIMAPLQGPPLPNGDAYENLTNLSIGMGGSATGKLNAANATPDTDMTDEAVSDQIALNAEPHNVLWRGTGTGIDSEETVKLRINGGTTEHPLPIKVKAMKYRSLNVTVFPVKASDAAPDVVLPTKSLLIKYLKETYGYQLNAWCLDPKYEEQKTYPYDPDSDKILSTTDAEYQGLRNAFSDPDADISILLIDGVVFVDVQNAVLAGDSPEDDKPVVISRVTTTSWTEDPATQGRPAPETYELVPRGTVDIIATIMHEMGHRIIGVGHPDTPVSTGPAPLALVTAGGGVKSRLMCSGNNGGRNINPGGRLVKKEWDAAEVWLKKREAARSQGGGP